MNIHYHSDFPISAGPKDMSGKILFSPVNFEKIQQCKNRQAWAKRAFGLARLFCISESLNLKQESGINNSF